MKTDRPWIIVGYIILLLTIILYIFLSSPHS